MFTLSKPTPVEPYLTLGFRGRYPWYIFPVRLQGSELARHKHVVGLSGYGKSKFLVHVASSLIMQGVPVSFIDPHGDSVRELLGVLTSRGYFRVPGNYEKFMYVDFGRDDLFVPFNVLSQRGFDANTSARNLSTAITRAYPELGITFKTIFLNVAYILSVNNLPFTLAIDVLNDKGFREKLLENITDELTLKFFRSEVDSWDTRTAEEYFGSTKRRLYDIFAMPQLYYSLGQKENILDFNKILNSGISVAYNLAGVHNDIRALVGCFLTVGYEQAIFARKKIAESERIPHHLIIDEAPLFIEKSKDTMMSLLSEARKYAITEHLAHQYYSQLDERFLDSLTNAQPIIFGVNHKDALRASYQLGRYDPYAVKHTITDEELRERSTQFFSPNEQSEMMAHKISNLHPRMAITKRKRKLPFHPASWQSVMFRTPDVHISCPREEIDRICDYYAKLLLKPGETSLTSVPSSLSAPVIRRFGKK